MIRDILGIAEHEGALQYSGIPISRGRLLKAECDRVVQAVQERVEGLQERALSLMGRIILIRSVLISLAIYMLSDDVLSKSMALKVEQFICALL